MLQIEKNQLREFYLKMRLSITASECESASKKITYSVIDSDIYKKASLLLCYISVRNEVDTGLLLADALEKNKIVGIPFCENGNMVFKMLTSLYCLTQGAYGIPTVKDGEIITSFTDCLCVVPALSADSECNRLGYGAGYYDRFLSENSDVFSLCICYDKCIAEKLPHDERDIAVNSVLTERNLFGGALNA